MVERLGYTWEMPKKKPPKKYPKGHCQYCGKKLTGRQRLWCASSNHGYLYWLYYKPHYIYWADWKIKILRRDKYTCQDCGTLEKDLKLNVGLEVHHIKPISKGGAEFDEDNCITLCYLCHKKRHAVSPKSNINDNQKFLDDYLDNFMENSLTI